MNDLSARPPLLIADPDHGFLQAIKTDPLARAQPPLIVTDEETASELLGPGRASFDALFLNPCLGKPQGLSLIRRAIAHHPGMPIFLLVDPGQPTLSAPELKRLAVRKALTKPLRYPQLLKALEDARLAFDPEEALALAAGRSEPVDQELHATDSDFVAISARNFMSGSACLFDVHVRLREGKYVKILKAGDAFAPERVANYLKKGVVDFYLRKEAQEAYLKYCDRLTAEILEGRRASAKTRISVTANQGEEVISFLRGHGIDDSAVQHAERFVDNVHVLAQQLRRQKNEILNRFLLDMDRVEHGVAITLISSFLTRPLQFEAQKSVQLVGLSALLHDIGLEGMDPKFASENEREWTVDECLEYRTHPDKGAEILGKLQDIDPTVIQAVEQHHERRSRTGFPHRLGAGALNRVAEVIGVSDELLKMIRETKEGRGANLQARLEISVYREFSAPVVDAFRQAFKL